ncbi:MAG: hypothetical protein MI867_20355 [Pseudomonadales bacterium]|nr:hypothetical protein [Pseudomonadales bacterium]
MIDDYIFGTKEAADYLCCARSTFMLYLKDGKIPDPYKVQGNTKVWKKKQLDLVKVATVGRPKQDKSV